MRIRLLTLMANPDGVFQPGSILDLDDERANDLISKGFAAIVEVSETATLPTDRLETATRRRRK